MTARVTPNEAMRLVLNRIDGHGRTSKQIDNGPQWITGCPTENHIAPLVRWDQRPDGKVYVHACGHGCTSLEVLAGLTIDDPRIRAWTPNGQQPFVEPPQAPRGRNAHPGDGLAIFEKLKAALEDGGFAGRRSHSGRYQCPACGSPGDGHGLRVDYDPNRNRRILLLCDTSRCPIEEILEPLGMTKAELCADDDTDQVSSPRGEETVEFSDAHLAAKAVTDFLAGAYCWALGLGWLRWDGTRWKRTPDKEIREQLRRWAVRNYEAAGKKVAEALKAGDKKTAEALAKIEQAWFNVCSRSKLNAIGDLAAGIVLRDTALFDAHPDLLNCPNGVVDLRTGALLPHDPSLLITKVAGCDFDPFATSPDWDKAIAALPDDEVANWMQIRLGQAATGYPPDDDVVPVGQGSGKNGKSTFFTGIARALGEYYTLVSDRVILANPGDHPTELMELRGARFALIEETPEERKFDVQRLKKITGTTEITARLIAQDSVTFTATHSQFVTSNHRPVITQTDYGTWRRLALVRFPRTFDGDSADPNLRDRVKREPAIHWAALAWIITGAQRWYANDRVTPAAPVRVAKDTEEWRVGSDLILGYWRDRLVADVDVHVMATDIYADFTAWLRDRGQGEWAERTFAERFRDHQEPIGITSATSASGATRACATEAWSSLPLPLQSGTWPGSASGSRKPLTCANRNLARVGRVPQTEVIPVREMKTVRTTLPTLAALGRNPSQRGTYPARLRHAASTAADPFRPIRWASEAVAASAAITRTVQHDLPALRPAGRLGRMRSQLRRPNDGPVFPHDRKSRTPQQSLSMSAGSSPRRRE